MIRRAPKIPATSLPTTTTGPVVVHWLHNGHSGCVVSELYGPPSKWPEGHTFSRETDKVNCPRCRVSR